ncbi:MAG: AI-2E family transporter [Anaerolineaceae bacterium]|nr:AI-2E family transporter [Anaerolineaceae bacterium]
MSQLDQNETSQGTDELVGGEDPSTRVSEYPGEPGQSPHWGAGTKLVVALSVVTIFAFLLFRFLNLIGPILLAFIIAYLFYPLAEWSHRRIGISWRAAVTILYLLFLVLLIGSITLGGLTVVEQIQNLIHFLTKAIGELPTTIANIASHPIQIGPFSLDLALLDVSNLTQQILGVVQPVLSQAGSSVVTVASGAASMIGWSFFILLISYFILAESGGFRLISFSIPGHADDVHRLGAQLGQIWNAFLRGKVTIVLLTITVYTVMLGILGVKFYFGLALLAGLARFIPYVGPFIAWTTYGLVSYFQGSTIFGITPFAYVGVVVGSAWLTDVFIDNYVTPRLMSSALKVHPAAVMVSALMAFNLLGVIGVVLAAPVLATVKLFMDYIFAKLFDRDPWEGIQTISPPLSFSQSLQLAQGRLQAFRKRFLKFRLTESKQKSE